ncbi:MAG: MarR family winged helix-turn-helix transcriptional regulator [Rhodoglobus sp.]
MDNPRPIGYWLTLVNRLIDEQFAATLDEHGVTRRQWQLLNVLSRNTSTVEQLDSALAPFLSAETPDQAAESSTEHLAELVESAWVDSTPAGYQLTDRGHAAFSRLAEVVTQQRTTITEGITTQEYESTISVLERMADNIQTHR